MPTALIGMGSNIDPEQHLTAAANIIQGHFEHVQFSGVYRSKAVGMQGDDFLNACCLFQYTLSEKALRGWLKALENEHGRDRSKGSWKPRTLDLDILMINQDILDDDVYKYGHIFVPALELVSLNAVENHAFEPLEKVNISLLE
jgi:2-amino-4-hydroxy-6-hydroxymethyldihydropteridine diphosphokinase